MKKKLLILLLLPLLLLSQINDEGLFSSAKVPSSAMILLDRSGSMGWTTWHYELIVRLNEYNWIDNTTHLSGWYDSEITPDGPGTMSDFIGDSANSDWALHVEWDDAGQNSVNLTWTLKIKSAGTWYTYDGGSHSWLGWGWEERDVVINVAGLGIVEDVECYVDATTGGGLTIGEMRINLVKAPRTFPYQSTRIKDALIVIHSLLDANHDGLITDDDENYLQVELGYGFHRSASVYLYPAQYGSANRGQYYDENTLTWKVASNGPLSCDSLRSSFVEIWNDINFTSNGGGTPNGVLLYDAGGYINTWKSNHPAYWCMKHNFILITDGMSNNPTVECSDGQNAPAGGGYTDWSCSKDVVRQAYRVWHNDSIKIFAVGFGEGIGDYGANELNWVSRWAGTVKDTALIDSLITYHGMDTMKIDPRSGCPSGFPGDYFLDGYAHIAKTTGELSSALYQIFMQIAAQDNYSFSQASVSSVEEEFLSTEYESRLYVASFRPDTNPLWKGTIKALKLTAGSFNLDSIPDSLLIWDAGESLGVDMTAKSRNIYGIDTSGTMLPFIKVNFDSAALDVSSMIEANSIIERVRDGLEIDDKGELGDIYHSSPLRLHLPNYFYEDEGFNEFRGAMGPRSSLIYAGGNDGMLHCFIDSVSGQGGRGGEELWAIIPMNFIPKVKNLLYCHDYYIDTDPMAADVWFPANVNDSIKQWDEWHTVLIACQGEGGRSFTALDVTDPLSEISGNSTDFAFLFSAMQSDLLKDTLGYTTSTPVMYKVGVDWAGHSPLTIDRFYAFMGGGIWPEPMDVVLIDSISSGGMVKGNVIIAFDVWNVVENGINGNVLLIPPASGDGAKMKYPFPATPDAVNVDPEFGGRYDLLFIPDAAGQLWCIDLRNPDPTTWRAKCIFQPELPSSSADTTKWHPAFFKPLIWKDRSYGGYWVTYGTGNRSDIFSPANERFYALHYPDSVIEDSSISIPLYSEGDLGTPGSPTAKGWMLYLQADDEKVVTQAVDFEDSLEFLTFSPSSTSLDTLPCEIGGTGSIARSYSFDIRTGGTAVITGTPIGTGIPQAPRYSFSLDGTGKKIRQTSNTMEILDIPPYISFKEITKWKEE